MINIFVTINVTADKRAKVLELLAELTAASQKENGNLRYQYYLHPTDPLLLPHNIFPLQPLASVC